MNLEFDYIVVGAGSAGCIVANKLSEDPGVTVLLVESGPPDTSPLIDMPRGLARLLRPGSPYVWTYDVSRGGNGPADVWLKGKGLGGSSAINGMVYLRGNPADYDEWEANGCTGWGSGEADRIYAAMEDHALGAGGGRGVGGPIKITMQPPSPLGEAVLDAAQQAGMPRVTDVNAASDSAVGYQPRNIWRGKRQSAAKAFLRPASRRPNLTVLTDTDALRLIFEGRRAAAVELRGKSGPLTGRARREIVLAAGALQTPKLLQLSGIGPAAHLNTLGIDVIADAPEVGENLQDHLYMALQFRVSRGSFNHQFAGPRLFLNLLRYLILGQGPMTFSAYEVCGFFKTRPDLPRPDAQIGVGLYTMKRSETGVAIDSQPGLTMGGYVCQPEGRGVMRITSADPDAKPFIDANYFATPADRQGAIAVVRHIREIAAQPALRDFITEEIRPGPDVVTDDQIADAYLNGATTAFHVSGTCRMGADPRSVVDPELRVRGVEGLRVADTSIMPTLVSANTNAAAMMIGWRAAELIRADQTPAAR